MSLDEKEQKLLSGTECASCKLCDGVMAARIKRNRQVLCSDGIVRPTIRAGRECGYKSQISSAKDAPAFSIAALRS